MQDAANNVCGKISWRQRPTTSRCGTPYTPHWRSKSAAERQDVSSRGWSVAEPPESKSCGPCRVAASQSPDVRDRGAATRLLLVSARDRGFRCSTPGYSSYAAPRRFVSPGYSSLRRSAAVCRTIRTTRPFIDAQKRECTPKNWGYSRYCIGHHRYGAAERQDVNSRGWTQRNPRL